MDTDKRLSRGTVKRRPSASFGQWPERARGMDTLILTFQSLEPRETKHLLSKSPGLWYFVLGTNNKCKY